MTRIGIMQGRLVAPEGGRFQSFPRDGWRNEFAHAAKAGLQTIEWIYDAYGEGGNPIETDAGIAEMQQLCARHNIEVASVCADYFMDRPIVLAGQELGAIAARLHWLLERCSLLRIKRVVVPFVDAARMRDEVDRSTVAQILREALPAAQFAGVEIHLETDLDARGFAALLEKLDHGSIRVNYDSGNSASLGYLPVEEFAAYGSRIGSVHIKDRKLGGGTVKLGFGDTDFAAVFRGLRNLNYAGDFVLQAARDQSGAEVALAAHNRLFVERYVHEGRACDSAAS